MNKETCLLRLVLLFITAAVLSLTFSACGNSVFSNNKIECVKCILPDFGEALNNSVTVGRWYVCVTSVDGCESFFVSDKDFFINVRKNHLTSITAIPLLLGEDPAWGDCRERYFFECAGTVLPYYVCRDGKNFEVQLTWEDGFCAFLMQRIFCCAIWGDEKVLNYVGRFNWKRLNDTVRTKIAESLEMCDGNYGDEGTVFYNPWLLDTDAIVQKIANGNFSSTALNLKNVFVCELGEISCSEGKFISSFVVENDVIRKCGKVVLKKDWENLIMFGNDCTKGVIISGNNGKNLSVISVYMPIFYKGL